MNYQVLFFIAVALLVAAIVGIFIIRGDRDKYLLRYRPLKTERDKLKESNESLTKQLEAAKEANSTLKTDLKTNKKAAKSTAKANKTAAADNATPANELEEKLERIKDEVANLKEENYRLKLDNKDLRKASRERDESDNDDAKKLVALRDERDEARFELTKANEKIAALEKKIAENANAAKSSEEAKSADKTAATDDETERLTRENATLSASLKDVRAELASFKKDYRDQLGVAKKELALETKPIRDENAQLKRQLQQSKTRADNNHKIFLVARAQLMLAEKRLSQFDAKYKPLILGTSSAAIDDAIKKFLTQEARESHAGQDIFERDRKISELQAQIEDLTAKNAELEAKNSASDANITDLVNSLAEDLQTPSSDLLGGSLDELLDAAATPATPSSTPSLVGLDLSSIDEGWDEL